MVIANFKVMAEYNALMNQKICASILTIPNESLWQDQKAFFSSILGTLNHLMVGDLIWLNRFNKHPNYPTGVKALESLQEFPLPSSLTQILFEDKQSFITARQALDQVIIKFINELNEDDCLSILSYQSTKGEVFNKPFFMLLQHLFNHQTHHRGQVTTLLSQIGIDIGETDLLVLIPSVNS
ncbi:MULTISPECIES: DinB family protein [Psychrobacter]|uniref:DinB family protein n=1 Tax=Psychrobacter TaxID=497 RepID=UPI0016604258|nr:MULTISPECIES: DinB family protein [Psychrobacter]